MNSNRYILLGIFALIIISACSPEQSLNYVLDGESVLVDDANIYLKATPHTLKYSGWVEVEFISKVFGGDIDFAFGFDNDKAIPSRLEIYSPHNATIEKSYTCEYDFNFTTNPKHATCFNKQINGTQVFFDRDFDKGNLAEKTIFWNITELRYWKDWQLQGSVNHEFDGKNKWYYSTNQKINAGQTYKIRYYMEIPSKSKHTKYDIAIKPSSKTIQQAVADDQLYFLDPWYDSGSLSDDLIAYYPMDNATLCDNVAGTSYNCTNQSTTRLPSYLPTDPQDNTFHTSDGDSISITTLDIGASLSIASWHNATGHDGQGNYIASSNIEPAFPQSLSFGAFVFAGDSVANNGEYIFNLGSSVNNLLLVSDNFKSSNTQDEWNFVVATYNNVTGRADLYVGNQTDLDNWSATVSGARQSEPFNDLVEIGQRTNDHASDYEGGLNDEVIFWNRSITYDEVIELWNNGVGRDRFYGISNRTLTFEHNITPTLPSTSSGSLNCSARIVTESGLNFNASINWSNTSSFIQQFNFTDRVNNSFISANVTSPFIVDQIMQCDIYAHERDNVSISNTSQFNRTILDTTPAWSENPNNLTLYHTENITLDYDCSDPDGAVTYHILNLTTDMDTQLAINSISGNISHDPTFNDINIFRYNVTCAQGATNISQELNITVNQNINFTQNTTKQSLTVGGNVTFLLDFEIINFTTQPAGIFLNFNGSTFDALLADSGIDGDTYFYNFTYELQTSLGQGNTSGVRQKWNWSFNITDVVTDFTTNVSNLTLFEIGIDDCSTHTQTILNLTLLDEGNNSIMLDGTLLNTKIGVDINLSSYNNESIRYGFAQIFNNRNNVTICVPDGSINDTSFNIDSTIEYSATDHATEFWLLDRGNLSILNTFNAYTTKTVGLRDITLTNSKTFLMSFFNENGLQENNVIIIAYRKYVGENLFREVERAREVQSVGAGLHLLEEDAIYFFRVTQNGTILFTSEELQALCTTAAPCRIDLEALEDFVKFGKDWDLVPDGAYSISSDSSARTVTLTFSASNSSNWTLVLYQYSNNPANFTTINSTSLTSISGTIVSSAPQTAGNVTVVARIYRDGTFLRDTFVNLNADISDLFTTAGGVVLAALITLTLILMAASEGPLILIFAALGYVFSALLGLFSLSWAAFISILILTMLLIYKISRRET